MSRLLAVIVVSALSAFAASCDEKLSSITGPTPELEPIWQRAGWRHLQVDGGQLHAAERSQA